MTRSSSPTRLLAVLAATAIAVAVLTVPSARPAEAVDINAVVDITYPLGREVRITDSYYARRSHGYHEAIDLMAPKGTPIHAAMGGRVTYAPTYSKGSGGFMIFVAGDDGRSYRYMHLNNDNPGTDDGRGGVRRAFADGVRDGARIERGQLIGWVGDSGNAEWTGSHLHFEIHQGRVALNPYFSVRAAFSEGDVPWAEPEPVVPEGWLFADIDPSTTLGAQVQTLVSANVTKGCSETHFCPDWTLTRGQMALFLQRTLGLPDGNTSRFPEIRHQPTAEAAAALAEHGISQGCGDGSEFCVANKIKRGQLAYFVAQSLELEPAVAALDDAGEGELFAQEIGAVVQAGFAEPCTNSSFCTYENVPRAEMAAWLTRVLQR